MGFCDDMSCRGQSHVPEWEIVRVRGQQGSDILTEPLSQKGPFIPHGGQSGLIMTDLSGFSPLFLQPSLHLLLFFWYSSFKKNINFKFVHCFKKRNTGRPAVGSAWKQTSWLLLLLNRKLGLMCVLNLLRSTEKMLQITATETDTYFSCLIPIRPHLSAPWAWFTLRATCFTAKTSRKFLEHWHCLSICVFAKC